MSERYDALVIGASIGGMAAAALLSGSGARVLLLEKEAAPPEPAGPLFALDSALARTLKLARHGLVLANRDLALTSWDDEAPPLTLTRDRRATARALALLSGFDGEGWAPFQALLQGQGRVLRRWWESARRSGEAGELFWSRAARSQFDHLCLMGVRDFLFRHFESPRLVGVLMQDALLGGLAPSEPGSALALIWRAAQVSSGLPGALARAEPRSLTASLRAATQGPMRFGATVSQILTWRGAAAGVRLADGETLEARMVLSSLDRPASEALAGLVGPTQQACVGEAALALTLRDGLVLPPALIAGRVRLAVAPEDYADAHEAARAGRLPRELPLDILVEGPRRLRISTPLAPAAPPGGWAPLTAPFAVAALKRLSRHVPGLAQAVTDLNLTPPRQRPRADLARMLAPAVLRASTRIDRLLLCGQDAEPLPCVSGRAGRFAATFAAQALK
jgi:phytoene dehydrogenase-like protein